MSHKSPCFTCTRVKDPKNCENKTCRDWQAWFIDRWESIRDAVRKDMHQVTLQEDGVPLGGERYASPHRVKAYLAQDPCDTCPCKPCRVPCPIRNVWEEKKGAKE